MKKYGKYDVMEMINDVLKELSCDHKRIKDENESLRYINDYLRREIEDLTEMIEKTQKERDQLKDELNTIYKSLR